jgi:predicted glycoside hydrolase/deacetylase ChbG (UPF0249 family)
MKTLITADDFGFTHDTNRAIVDAFEKHRITELSLMIDSHGTDEAIKYIRDNGVKDVGLHFSLNRLSRAGKTLQGKEYDEILNTWSKEQLINAFDEEVNLFEQRVGFVPKHIIGHKQIALHSKLVEHVADYCVRNNCYARKAAEHTTLKKAEIPSGLNIGRTVDRIFTFRYGNPEEMYFAYKNDIVEAKKKSNLISIEVLFHPGYAGEFEKGLTSFIQERIEDSNFLLSEYFLRLVEEEGLELVPSQEV